MTYKPFSERYTHMTYNRLGNSGLKVPAISLGLYRNFGETDDFAAARDMITAAFDLGITHFDLANNYGEPSGSAEKTFGRILKEELAGYRDELLIATKAGYDMWPGPYGEWGSRKYMLSSLDQSLLRLGLDYVDIYYSHRFDPDTPLEETAGALDTAIRQGKVLYAGISNYPAEATTKMIELFREMRTPFVSHQPNYSMFLRHAEEELFPALSDGGIGAIVFQPLYQGLLTTKYFEGIPSDSRVAKGVDSISADQVTEDRVQKVRELKHMADERGQTVAQLAIAWSLRNDVVASALIGASRTEQVIENVKALDNLSFSQEELTAIDSILKG
ncbi:L-glyceraldehyde 3-phosphate reductase [Bacillus salacetis]|uniref:L-glyceraldehyde 3-phosphate reductase n=1 Tax=Bacillus salacetis TaxID=2315464 RepID=A0A3A1R1T4_9BACI|nr:aldo/keto reductase [Bacillus salacetis]RIW34253.1 L-glyceraldehyde 3-phosphate reductase [Bacillus salacetis]